MPNFCKVCNNPMKTVPAGVSRKTMSEKSIILLFSFFVWGIISSVALGTSIEEKIYDIDFEKKVKSGECMFLDQYGICWSAKEFQDYLTNKKSSENILKDIPEELKNKEANEEFMEEF